MLNEPKQYNIHQIQKQYDNTMVNCVAVLLPFLNDQLNS